MYDRYGPRAGRVGKAEAGARRFWHTAQCVVFGCQESTAGGTLLVVPAEQVLGALTAIEHPSDQSLAALPGFVAW
jgi:hypothetical protein